MDDWLHTRAKTMRREPALYERRLWTILRDRRLEGLKFRRQVVIGRYVADFVGDINLIDGTVTAVDDGTVTLRCAGVDAIIVAEAGPATLT